MRATLGYFNYLYFVCTLALIVPRCHPALLVFNHKKSNAIFLRSRIGEFGKSSKPATVSST